MFFHFKFLVCVLCASTVSGSFLFPGSLTEHLISKGHGKETCCYPGNTHEGTTCFWLKINAVIAL